MATPTAALPTLERLYHYVRDLLCEFDRLDPLQTPLFRAPVVRQGRVCGALFYVEGPRQLRTSAVWASDEFRLIFYDSSGARFQEVLLSESPPAEEAAPEGVAA